MEQMSCEVILDGDGKVESDGSESVETKSIFLSLRIFSSSSHLRIAFNGSGVFGS